MIAPTNLKKKKVWEKRTYSFLDHAATEQQVPVSSSSGVFTDNQGSCSSYMAVGLEDGRLQTGLTLTVRDILQSLPLETSLYFSLCPSNLFKNL